jgi:hypothetical protein
MSSRRAFLRSSMQASLGLAAAGALPGSAFAASLPPRPRAAFAGPLRGWRGESSVAAALRAGNAAVLDQVRGLREPTPRAEGVRGPLTRRFPDLRQHFLFEYYPWYGGGPDFVHWDQFDRVPPLDLASNYVPRLGAYDSRSAAVVEQHARWMADCGAGGISYSWWGPDSFEDRNVNLVMDVMHAHGLKVSFHMESYVDDRGERFAADVEYLLREYGEKRKWDAFLLLRDAEGAVGPLFKGFRMILPESFRDCNGIEHFIDDYTADSTWRRQVDRVRDSLRRSFDHVTILADSLDFGRTVKSGFDGIAIYDQFIEPARYAPIAEGASRFGLLSSLNVNPGYDTIEPRRIEPGSCYVPTPFVPATLGIDFDRAADRELAAERARERITESMAAALAVQVDPALQNARRGFFLVYLNSFNEWHEGHSFEPMKDAAALSPVERSFGYHNPLQGDYRLALLRGLLQPVVAPAAAQGRMVGAA